MKLLTTEEFIKKAREVHGDTYDYSNVVYKNTRTKVKIKCKTHGEWEQTPQDHIQGRGCPHCGKLRCYNANKHKLKKRGYDNTIFIEKANIIHNRKYDYNKLSYINSRTKITVICPLHGEWNITPAAHLNGKGCPHCCSSKGEEHIAKLLRECDIQYKRQKRFSTCRNVKTLPFDFYLPEFDILIEYQGQQHYTGWKGDKTNLLYIQHRDAIKYQWAKKNNYKLFYITYKDSIDEKIEELIYENNILKQEESSMK